MTNNEIAQFLFEIGEMLDIKGENSFKVNAYKKAARSIEHLTYDIEDIYHEKKLTGLFEIEGVGESIALKIAEILDTGKSKYYDDLTKDVPKGELFLTKIPGIGARTAQKLYQKLKIKNLKELEKAAKLGKISSLFGFGPKIQQNILENIKRVKKREKRMLISFAEPIAREILEYLKSNPKVFRADTVGSLRRFKETIGDIDIVVSSKNPQDIINYFMKFPKIKKIVNKGDTKISILHQKEGVRVDLEILKPNCYGSLLQHLTGSREHNIHLRKYANSMGLSLSEYGITNLKTKKIEFFTTEEDFYKKLKLSYIEPELREDRGEIEAAQKEKLPYLIKEKDIKGDFHTHTNWSEGRMTIEEVIEYALSKGYQYIAICDHSSGLGITKGLNEEKLLAQISKIKELNKKFGDKIRIFSGVEVNIKTSGELDVRDEILEKLDIVVGSVHSSLNQNEKMMTKRLLSAIYNPNIDILGHPSGRILRKREECKIEWSEIFKAAAYTKTILEINCHPERLDLKDDLIYKARDWGIKFAINSDAHLLEQLNQIKYGVGISRRGWLEKKDVINTLPLNKLIEWFKNK